MRPLRLTLLLTGLIIAPPAVALGAAASYPIAPTLATQPATGESSDGATLHGTVNPNGSPTSYAFQWGPTAQYGRETPLTSAGAGHAPMAASATLTGLNSGTTYHFRIIAIDAGGNTRTGGDEAFKTTGQPPVPGTPPTATTGAASAIAATTASLGGTVNPGGHTTTAYFEYGKSSTYGQETTETSAGSGVTPVSVTQALATLQPGTTYHYRLVAVSATGTALGADHSLTTLAPPEAVTGAATLVSGDSAQINGTVNPEGHPTSYAFQFGLTAGYGRTTASVAAGSGRSPLAARAFLSGLSSRTTYHYRLVATSADGTTYGVDRMFVTNGPTVTQSSGGLVGRQGFVSPRGVASVGIGCFGGTTACSGTIELVRGGRIVGKRNFALAAESGGLVGVRLNRAGRRLLRRNRPHHSVHVLAMISTTGGATVSGRISLVRWVWR